MKQKGEAQRIPTFNNITKNRGSEFFSGLLIEVLPMNNAHLLEEGGLAALPCSKQ